MNVIVFTSAMVEKEFAVYQKEAHIKPNPSNQNFYNKLIKALSFKNNVSVVSHRPFVKGMFDDDFLQAKQTSDGKVKYYYTKLEATRSYKLFDEVEEIVLAAEKAVLDFSNEPFICIVDTLRINLVKGAVKFARKYNAKIVGMLTDNPANLSHVRRSYVKNVYRNTQRLDAFLTLSNGLLRAFKVTEKPNYIFEGLVDEIPTIKKQPIGNYYFFGGSLYERYGVKRLINAFLESNIQEKMVIAGNGPLKDYIYQVTDKSLKLLYLSQLPVNQIYGLEQHAIANINPRPFSKKLDDESVPSKLLEYLSSGIPTISTIHSKLYEIFKNDIYWIEDDTTIGIKNALNDFAKKDYDEMLKRAIAARVKVYEIYGLKNQSERITYFLTTINS